MEKRPAELPLIKRARGFRLYGHDGRRYLDCARDGGRALLGHKPHLLVRDLKQVLEQGLVADLPSVYERRLRKVLTRLFPAYRSFLIDSTYERLWGRISALLGTPLTAADAADPLSETVDGRKPASVWRPYSRLNLETDLLLPVIPFAIGTSPAVLCSKNELPPDTAEPVSPLALAGAHRALLELSRTALPDWYSPSLIGKGPYLVQKDLYLVAHCTPPVYTRIFKLFLDHGVLLSPRGDIPSLLPLELSSGEQKLLLELCHANLERSDR
ncbi:MAG TPA: hypothetical protein ENN69_04935 [Spirochaetia bacterium]|nr:hypothetical protein [Spirochaetia bacterium]